VASQHHELLQFYCFPIRTSCLALTVLPLQQTVKLTILESDHSVSRIADCQLKFSLCKCYTPWCCDPCVLVLASLHSRCLCLEKWMLASGVFMCMYTTPNIQLFTCIAEVELLWEFEVVHWGAHGTLTSRTCCTKYVVVSYWKHCNVTNICL
jgi:hypothetical protein